MTKDKRSKFEIRAYEIWEREGRPDGKATEHWEQAVAEIASEEAEAKAAKSKKPATRKKTAGGTKAEKPTPAARTKKQETVSAAGKGPKDQAKKATATKTAAAAVKKPKKTAK